jgi:hypothetical protein
VYEPGVSPVTVVDEPDAEVTTGPGLLVKVHVPGVGNPFKITLPVATEQVV